MNPFVVVDQALVPKYGQALVRLMAQVLVLLMAQALVPKWGRALVQLMAQVWVPR